MVSELESPLATSLCEGGMRGRCWGTAPSLAEGRCLVPGTSSWPAIPSLWLLGLSCRARAGWGAPRGSRLSTMPCCWWSRGCFGCSRCCGWYCCSQRRPGQPLPPRAPACWGHLRGVGRGGGQGPSQDSPLPQRLHWVCPRVVWIGMGQRLGILTGARVDVPECSCEQGPNEEGSKGDTQHRGQDKAFACVTKGRPR